MVVFGVIWSLLLAIAVAAQVASSGVRSRRQAGPLTNLLIAVPFVLVLGFFYLERWIGAGSGSEAARLAGAALAASGLGLYVAAHVYLGRNWSIAAAIMEGQRLVTGGPYRHMRHPMYTAMMVVVIGSGLLVSDYLILASIVPVAAAYYVRASYEERLLATELPGYRAYAVRTKMFIPGVF